MGLGTFVKGNILKVVVDKVAKSEPRTTVLGFMLSAVVASQIDYNKLLQGDTTQIGNLVATLVIAVLGYYTNHPKLQAPAPPAPAQGVPPNA